MSISDIPILGPAFNLMGAGLAAVGVGGDDTDPDPNAPTNYEVAAMTASVHDLIEEILDLHRKGFVRHQVTWMAKQLLRLGGSGAIHTAVKEQVIKWTTPESRLCGYVEWLTSLIWPNGKLFASKPPPSENELAHWRQMAKVALLKAIPSIDKLQTLLGRDYCIGSTLKSVTSSFALFVMKAVD